MRRPSIVFFGSGPVAAASLNFLAKHFEIEAVVTKPTTEKEMSVVIGKSVYTAQNAAELDELIKSKGFRSKLGIIVDFGVIVSRKVIDYFPLGIINSHFSLLPQWRGADPISFAVLSGQPKTGVSLMIIDTELDTGKLIAQKSLKIAPDASTPSLTKDLIVLSNQMFLDYLPAYMTGNLKPHAQPHPDRATYSRKLTKADGVIDWTKPAEQVEREVRAYLDWPKSQTIIGDKEVIVLKAHVEDKKGNSGKLFVDGKKLGVYTSKNALIIDSLKPAGKNEMDSQSFLAGYGQLLN